MGSFQKQTRRIQVPIVSLRGDSREHWLRRGETGKETKTVMGVIASQFLVWVPRGQSNCETLEDRREHASDFYPQGTRKVKDLLTNSPTALALELLPETLTGACLAYKPNVL